MTIPEVDKGNSDNENALTHDLSYKSYWSLAPSLTPHNHKVLEPWNSRLVNDHPPRKLMICLRSFPPLVVLINSHEEASPMHGIWWWTVLFKWLVKLIPTWPVVVDAGWLACWGGEGKAWRRERVTSRWNTNSSQM